MRRGTILVLGLSLLASSALPEAAVARPRLLGAVLGVLTAPLGILGARRHSARLSHQRKAYVARSKASTRYAAPAAAGAAVGAGAAVAATSSKPSEAATPVKTDGAAPAATPVATTAPPEAARAEATAGIAPQQNAALATSPEDTTTQSAPAKPRIAPQLGVIGPAAWPSAFEDVVGYALWPREYGERLRAHGIGDVMATAFTPGAALAARTKTANADDGKAESFCGNPAAASTDWPAAEIERTLTLNDPQRTALGQFTASFKDAVATIRAICKDEAAPVDRLRAMQNTLWAVHDAAQLVRAPLARFYDSLTAEQKKQFAPPAAQTDARTAGRGDMARMCNSAPDLPVRQIEQTVKTNKAQRASLDTLQKKSFEMGQFLMASCLKPMPATPAERLDNAADRLTAVIFAASNVNTAINEFTNQLDADQKAKLTSIGR